MARRGRYDKTPSTFAKILFEFWWAFGIMVIAGLIVIWHTSVVLTTSATWGDLGVSITGLVGMLRGAGLAAIPGASWWTLAVLALLFLAIGVAIVSVSALVTMHLMNKPGKGMATKAEVRAKLSAEAVLSPQRDGRLWPETSTVPDKERTFCVGTAQVGGRGIEAHLGQEQHLGVVAPTGVGKTYRILSRAALSAPGALVATSTKADLLDLIAEPRAEKGTVWVFDLLDLVSWPSPIRWDILRGCEDTVVARARAGQLVKGGKKDSHTAGGGDSNAEFFLGRARAVLQSFLHAAALGDKTIADVLRWAAALETDDTAVKILREHPDADPLLARRLQSAITGASDTVSSIRQTLDDALDALSLQKINRQFIEQEGMPSFDPDAFVRSSDTLVIIADDNDPTDVTSLVAVLVDAVFQAAKSAARRTESGRLSPPLRAVLDEVANICPLPNFPKMLSDLRGYGVQIVYGLQGRAQTRKTWGPEGAQMIVDNSAAQLVLGGIKDADQLKDLSELAGMADVQGLSTQIRDHGMSRGNQTTSEQEKKVLRPEEIAKLDKGEGLLLMGDISPVVLDLPGWTELPEGSQLEEAVRRTAKRRIAAAQQHAAA
ncbi:MAG: type IV secretory system conjugative DNA transfer family protein [Brachybacterium sp.]